MKSIDFSDTNFYYINFDDERWLGFEAKEFNIVYESLLETFGNAKTFLIDEIQNIKGFELFVRRFYDDGFKFIITGSNSDLLSKELGTRLTGRRIMSTLHPFSWKEFLILKKIEQHCFARTLFFLSPEDYKRQTERKTKLERLKKLCQRL